MRHEVPSFEEEEVYDSMSPAWRRHAELQPAYGPRLLRTSERGDFRRCPWLWDKVWNKGYRNRRSPVWAWFGTAVHAGLEAYYPVGRKRGTVQEAVDAFYESVGEQSGNIYTEDDGPMTEEALVEIVDAKQLGEAMIRGYIEHYGGDTEWEVIHTEQPFQINVPDPVTGSPLVVYAGTWDVLMRNRFTKEFWLWDHKTRKSFPQQDKWTFYTINDQAGSYLWVAPEVLKFLGVFKPTDVIQGLVFNALRKHLPDDRPQDDQGRYTNKPTKEHYWNALIEAGHTPAQAKTKYKLEDLVDAARRRGVRVVGEVSKRQPPPLFHREIVYRTSEERVTQAKRVQAEAVVMSKMASGELPMWKYPTEDCPRCPMFDYCEMDEQDPESAEAFAQGAFKTIDPYRDHREVMQLKGGVEL